MKTLWLAGATLALLTAVNVSPAMAQGTKLSGGNTWPGISQRVDTGSANPATTTAHYEYQYGYDKHAAWRRPLGANPLADGDPKISVSLQVPTSADGLIEPMEVD